jgi:hypothetical protein
MQKKVFILAFFIAVFMLSFVSALGEKIEFSLAKETFLAGESITLKVSLYDAQDKPIDANINLFIEDAEKNRQINQVIFANTLVDISLGKDAPAGIWKISAEYQNPVTKEAIKSSTVFMVELNELARFDLNNGTLAIINIGNTRYVKTIYITIGETIGTKNLDLGIGEKLSFRLVAPQGVYNVKVTDGKTTISQNNVALTGKAIGVLDERPVTASPLTAGVRANDESLYNDESQPTFANKSFVYIFLLVLLGASILLVIERRYRRKAYGYQ